MNKKNNAMVKSSGLFLLLPARRDQKCRLWPSYEACERPFQVPPGRRRRLPIRFASRASAVEMPD